MNSKTSRRPDRAASRLERVTYRNNEPEDYGVPEGIEIILDPYTGRKRAVAVPVALPPGFNAYEVTLKDAKAQRGGKQA